MILSSIAIANSNWNFSVLLQWKKNNEILNTNFELKSCWKQLIGSAGQSWEVNWVLPFLNDQMFHDDFSCKIKGSTCSVNETQIESSFSLQIALILFVLQYKLVVMYGHVRDSQLVKCSCNVICSLMVSFWESFIVSSFFSLQNL